MSTTEPRIVVPQRLVVTLNSVSGISKDAVITDFTFDNPSVTVLTHVTDFFNAIQAVSGSPINGYMSPTLSRVAGANVVHTYDMTSVLAGTGPMGAPIATNTWGLGGGGGSPLPSELAVVLTYHASDATIPEHAPGARPRARYRGRCYIGPMATSALTSDSTTHRATVASAVRDTITSAANTLLTAEPSWCVWSRKDRVLRRVVGGWVDDAWDIQRRRGEEPVARKYFP